MMPKARLLWRAWAVQDAVIIPGGQRAVRLNTEGTWPSLESLGVAGDYTVRRLRGIIAATSAAGTETNSVDFLTWGAYVADVDAVNASAFAESDEDPADWFAFGHLMVPLQGAFSAAIHGMSQNVIDNRAMRKVNENHQTIMLMIDASATNLGNLVVTTVGRMLISYGRQ